MNTPTETDSRQTTIAGVDADDAGPTDRARVVPIRRPPGRPRKDGSPIGSARSQPSRRGASAQRAQAAAALPPSAYGATANPSRPRPIAHALFAFESPSEESEIVAITLARFDPRAKIWEHVPEEFGTSLDVREIYSRFGGGKYWVRSFGDKGGQRYFLKDAQLQIAGESKSLISDDGSDPQVLVTSDDDAIEGVRRAGGRRDRVSPLELLQAKYEAEDRAEEKRAKRKREERLEDEERKREARAEEERIRRERLDEEERRWSRQQQAQETAHARELDKISALHKMQLEIVERSNANRMAGTKERDPIDVLERSLGLVEKVNELRGGEKGNEGAAGLVQLATNLAPAALEKIGDVVSLLREGRSDARADAHNLQVEQIRERRAHGENTVELARVAADRHRADRAVELAAKGQEVPPEMVIPLSGAGIIQDEPEHAAGQGETPEAAR